VANFVFVPAWVVQDLIVYLVGILAVGFILKKEPHPQSILMEFLCFTFLYAAVYENFATRMGWYAYGPSLLMIANVPLSIPIIEYLVVYATLRLLGFTEMPAWCKPIIVGFVAMLFDFSLDPIAVKLIHSVNGGIIGRWSWYPRGSDVQIYGEPVYNFTGWVLICGYAASLLLAGRLWFRKSGYRRLVGILYPLLCMIGALGLLITPLSQLLLWLQPAYAKGSVGEWIMLGFWLVLPTAILLVFWRGRMKGRFSLRENWIVATVLIGFPALNVITTLAAGVFDILWLVALCAVAEAILVLAVRLRGRTLAFHG